MLQLYFFSWEGILSRNAQSRKIVFLLRKTKEKFAWWNYMFCFNLCSFNVTKFLIDWLIGWLIDYMLSFSIFSNYINFVHDDLCPTWSFQWYTHCHYNLSTQFLDWLIYLIYHHKSIEMAFQWPILYCILKYDRDVTSLINFCLWYKVKYRILQDNEMFLYGLLFWNI